jgi:hypothetical protein
MRLAIFLIVTLLLDRICRENILFLSKKQNHCQVSPARD